LSLLSAWPARAIYLDDGKTLFLSGSFYNQWRVRTEDPLRFNTQVGDWTTLQHRYFLDPQLRADLLPWLRDYGGASIVDTLRLNEARFFFNYRFEYDGVYDYGPRAFRRLSHPPAASTRSQLFEVYGDLRLFGRLSLRIGRQNLSWGETDGFRLLDRINPLDASFGGFLIPLDERRRPLTMLRATLGLPEPVEWGITNTAFEVFIAPDKRLPVAGAPPPTPWGTGGAPQPLSSTPTLVGSLLALGRFDVTTQLDRPDLNFQDSRMGARLLWTWQDITFTLAHLSTYPDAPTPSLQLGRTGNPILKLRFPNIQVTGATASGPVSAINVPVLRDLQYTVFRTEVAGFFGEPFFIEKQNFALGLPLPKRNIIRGVLGFDHNQWIRTLNPNATFFFTTQFFYSNIQGSMRGIKIPLQYHSGRFLDVDRESFLQTFAVNTLYSAAYFFQLAQVQPTVAAFYDWEGAWLFQPSLQFIRDPFRFTIEYTNIWGRFTSIGVLKDKDNLAFRVDYLL
jgi:hypothetical protein